MDPSRPVPSHLVYKSNTPNLTDPVIHEKQDDFTVFLEMKKKGCPRSKLRVHLGHPSLFVGLLHI
jgi:hypothetical protein